MDMNENPEIYNQRGCEYFQKDLWKSAIKAFTIAAGFNDVNRAKYLTNRGTVYCCKNNFQKAFKDFSSAILTKPDYTPPYGKRGFLFLEKYEREMYFGRGKKKDLLSAISDYSEAIALTPLEPEFFLNRAAAFDLLNDPERAFTDFCQAMELDNSPDSINLMNLGIAYAMKDDWYNAFKYFSRAKNQLSLQDSIIITNSNSSNIIKKMYQAKFSKVITNEFFIMLRQFIMQNEIEIFDKANFSALLSDFLRNDYKKEFLVLNFLVKQEIHKEIIGTKSLEESRRNIINNLSWSSDFKKDDLNQMIDILYCLVKDNDNFPEGGEKWEEVWPLT